MLRNHCYVKRKTSHLLLKMWKTITQANEILSQRGLYLKQTCWKIDTHNGERRHISGTQYIVWMSSGIEKLWYLIFRNWSYILTATARRRAKAILDLGGKVTNFCVSILVFPFTSIKTSKTKIENFKCTERTLRKDRQNIFLVKRIWYWELSRDY